MMKMSTTEAVAMMHEAALATGFSPRYPSAHEQAMSIAVVKQKGYHGALRCEIVEHVEGGYMLFVLPAEVH